MKPIFLFFLMLVCLPAATAQTKEKATPMTVNFSDDAITINNSKCFGYAKTGNDFVITDLSGKDIIKGAIRKNELGQFESTIVFVALGKSFSNKKIVGRNDLIFSLINTNVIGPDCRLDTEKLKKFIAENNELK